MSAKVLWRLISDQTVFQHCSYGHYSLWIFFYFVVNYRYIGNELCLCANSIISCVFFLLLLVLSLIKCTFTLCLTIFFLRTYTKKRIIYYLSTLNRLNCFIHISLNRFFLIICVYRLSIRICVNIYGTWPTKIIIW